MVLSIIEDRSNPFDLGLTVITLCYINFSLFIND